MTVPDAPTGSVQAARPWVQAVIGGALGLCVGTLMGMTTAPVVGTVVGALAALFATIFGVKDQDLSSFARIGGFGVFCVLGVVTGIYLRAHNSLGISAGQEVAEWTAAGFKEDVARSIVLYKQLGVLVSEDGHLTTTPRAEKVAAQPSVTMTTLSSRSTEECGNMAPAQFGDDPRKIIQSYKASGGDWERLGAVLDGLPPATQLKLIHAAYDLGCRTSK
jgi:hypothetical protein